MESGKPSGEDCFGINEGSDGTPLIQADMVTIVENTLEGLRISREREVFLQNSLKALMENDNFGINRKWLELRGKLSKAVRLNEFLLTATGRRVKAAQREQEVLKEKFQREVEDLKAQLEYVRTNFLAREAELQEQLELARAAAAVQRDETESNLKRQLVDANSRARNQQNEIRNLHVEIQNLRTRLSSKQSFSDLRNNVLIFNPTMNPQESSLDTLFEGKLQERFTSRPVPDPDRQDGATSRFSMASTASMREEWPGTDEGGDSNSKAEDTAIVDLRNFTEHLNQDQEISKPEPFCISAPGKFLPLNIFVEPKVPKRETPPVPRKRPRATVAIPPLLPCTVTAPKDVGEVSGKRRRRKLYNPGDYDN